MSNNMLHIPQRLWQASTHRVDGGRTTTTKGVRNGSVEARKQLIEARTDLTSTTNKLVRMEIPCWICCCSEGHRNKSRLAKIKIKGHECLVARARMSLEKSSSYFNEFLLVLGSNNLEGLYTQPSPPSQLSWRVKLFFNFATSLFVNLNWMEHTFHSLSGQRDRYQTRCRTPSKSRNFLKNAKEPNRPSKKGSAQFGWGPHRSYHVPSRHLEQATW